MQGRITKRAVDAASAIGARDHWLWDSELKGFGLRVRPGGRKVYVVEYRPGVGGRGVQKRRLSIGQHGSPWTPDTARKEARRLLGIVAAGGDPAKDRSGTRAAPTVEHISQRWLSEHVRPKRKLATADGYDRLLSAFVVPKLGKKRARDVAKRDVQQIHAGLASTPYQANRVLAIVSALFNFAELLGERPAHSNPASGIEKYPEQSRERLLSPQELAWLGEAMTEAEAHAALMSAYQGQAADARKQLQAARAIKDHEAGGDAGRRLAALRAERPTGGISPQALACFRLLFFTGARESEILGLQWPWVSFDRGEARLPDSKSGRKTIYLPAPALDVLASLPRLEGNPHVLPGERPGSHFVGIQKPWRHVRNAATVKAWAVDESSPAGQLVASLNRSLGRMPTCDECRATASATGIGLPTGLSDLRIHDLRHAFASVAASSGMGLPIIGKMLGHAQPSTTQRYAHLAPDPVRAAAASVAAKIAAGLGSAAAGDVLSFQRKTVRQ
jgi:integrase